MRFNWILPLALWMSVLMVGTSHAAGVGEPDAGEEISLEDVVGVFQDQADVVVSASRTKMRSREAPAVITSVSRQEIVERGYRSVAEVVSSLPGFYSVDDWFLPNVGVRGVSPGLRSWSRTLKVMIDGPAGRGQWAARSTASAWEVDGGVVVEGDGFVPGQIVTVRVTGAAAYDLFARVDRGADPALNILG